MQNKKDQDNQQLLEDLINRLSPADRMRVKSILADESAREKILSTPEAQKLMRELGGK